MLVRTIIAAVVVVVSLLGVLDGMLDIIWLALLAGSLYYLKDIVADLIHSLNEHA